jgi:hypothetical protein
MVPSLDNGLTFIETLSNPFQGGIQEPQGAALGIQTFLGQSITFFDPNPAPSRCGSTSSAPTTSTTSTCR